MRLCNIKTSPETCSMNMRQNKDISKRWTWEKDELTETFHWQTSNLQKPYNHLLKWKSRELEFSICSWRLGGKGECVSVPSRLNLQVFVLVLNFVLKRDDKVKCCSNKPDTVPTNLTIYPPGFPENLIFSLRKIFFEVIPKLNLVFSAK